MGRFELPSLLVALCLVLGYVAAKGEHPFSRMMIEHTTIDFHGSAYIKASPTMLGLNGSDTEWVTAEFGNPNATDGDWVAVFSPANFNATTCKSANKNEKAPLLCTAPIKFQYANYSSPSYRSKGEGSLKFQLINQRANFAFALFTGDFSAPKLIAVSNNVSFAYPKAPLWPRLALGKQWNEMTVTWTSGYDISEATALVEWGVKAGPRVLSPAATLTYGRYSVCGPPATTKGWRDPGFFHTSFLKELWPGTVYTYRVGHLLPSGSYVWGKLYSFKAPPSVGEKSLQRVVIFGDMGKAERDGSNEYFNTQPGSLNTTDTLIKDLDNIDMVIHNGDITYANGYLSQWDQFTAQIEPIASVKPYMISSGNHERDWPNSGSFFDVVDSGGECGVVADTMFYVPAENREKFWYSLDYGMFHFCVGHSELDWREGSEQYKFLEKCFASVDRQKQPWLVFLAHRVLGYSSSEGYVSQGLTAEPMSRENLQKLWQKYKVDMAFYGHEHVYERTCPVYESICVSSEKNDYKGPFNGTIHVTAGGGGKALDTFAKINMTWSLVKDLDFGFVKLTAHNYSFLQFEYKKSSTGKTFDSFTISRDYSDVLGCTTDSCNPTTLAT